MAITTDRDILRLEIGDTNPDRPLFADDELDVFLARYPGRVLVAAADACDSLAIRFARDFDFKWKDQSFSRSQMSARYAALAKDLRKRAAGNAAPFFGGGSQARKDALAQDPDRTQPAFRRGQFTPAPPRAAPRRRPPANPIKWSRAV